MILLTNQGSREQEVGPKTKRRKKCASESDINIGQAAYLTLVMVLMLCATKQESVLTSASLQVQRNEKVTKRLKETLITFPRNRGDAYCFQSQKPNSPILLNPSYVTFLQFMYILCFALQLQMVLFVCLFDGGGFIMCELMH